MGESSRTGKVNRPYLLRSRGLCRSFGDRGSGLIVAGLAGVRAAARDSMRSEISWSRAMC